MMSNRDLRSGTQTLSLSHLSVIAPTSMRFQAYSWPRALSILHPNSSHNWFFPTLNLMATDLTCTAKHTYSPAFQTQHPASFHETNGPRSQCRYRLCRLRVARIAELTQVLETPREQTASCMSLMTWLAQINASPVRVHSFKPSN